MILPATVLVPDFPNNARCGIPTAMFDAKETWRVAQKRIDSADDLALAGPGASLLRADKRRQNESDVKAQLAPLQIPPNLQSYTASAHSSIP